MEELLYICSECEEPAARPVCERCELELLDKEEDPGEEIEDGEA